MLIGKKDNIGGRTTDNRGKSMRGAPLHNPQTLQISTVNKRFQNIRLMQNRKAQMKIQEMSFMLLGLMLFFVIAGLFFLVISNAGLKQSAAALSEDKAIATISRLASSPELSCTGSIQLCVDTDKVLALKQSSAFNNYWQTSGGLVIRKLYPPSEQEIECDIGNYGTECSKYTLREPGTGFVELSSYVILCKKDVQEGYVYDKCELGMISAFVDKGGEGEDD